MAREKVSNTATYTETAGLAGPNFLFHGARTIREYSVPGLRSSALWMRRPKRDNESHPVKHGGYCIDDDVLDEFGSSVVTTPELLLPTVHALLGTGLSELPPDTTLNTVEHQFGTYAFIPVTRVVVPGQAPAHFVTCIARYPRDTEGGRYIHHDFDNLRALAHAFDNRLKPPHREQYNVIHPITRVHVPWRDHTYPVFTMPFIPLGEMHIDGQDVKDQSKGPDPLQVFSYPSIAKPVTPGQLQVHSDQSRRAWRIGRTFCNYGYSNSGGLEEAHRRLQSNRDYQDTKAQWRQIAIGEMLIYLLSGNRFPINHAMNAGDWMVHFKSPSRLNLTLITARGGLSRPMAEVDFLARLRVHREPNFGYDDTLKRPYSKLDIMPFYDWFTSEEFMGLWENAKSMIIPSDPTTIYQR